MKKLVTLLVAVSMLAGSVCLPFAESGKVIVQKEEEAKSGLVISLVGDMMFDQSVGRMIGAKGEDYVFGGYDPFFQKSDILIGNLETSVSGGGKPVKDKQFTFRSHPKMAEALKRHNFTAVSIANNHVLDYGRQAFLDTMKHLRDNGIAYAGGGSNKQEAEDLVIIEKNNMKIGFLAFSKVVPSVDWYAGGKTPGIVGAYSVHQPRVLQLIKEADDKCDVLVVSVHWGKEATTTVRSDEKNLAHKMVDAGADIIMGHHPHVVQGVELYKEKPIFYSLGNFIFTGSRLNLCTKTIMASLRYDENKKIEAIEIIPGIIRAGRPSPMMGKEKEDFIRHLNRLSVNFKAEAAVQQKNEIK